MNDDTTPPPEHPIRGDEPVTDEPADDAVLEALRSLPDDMDELFARKAIAVALDTMSPQSDTTPQSDTMPQSPRRTSSRRRLVQVGAVAASIVVATLVGIVSMRSSGQSASFATRSNDAATAGMDSGTDAVAENSHDESQASTGAPRPEEMAADDTTSDATGAMGTTATRPLPPIHLGRFDSIDSLLARVHDGMSDPTAVDGTRVEGTDDDTSDPDVDVAASIMRCAQQLSDDGYLIRGWASLVERPVIVAGTPEHAGLQVFDAITCTA